VPDLGISGKVRSAGRLLTAADGSCAAGRMRVIRIPQVLQQNLDHRDRQTCREVRNADVRRKLESGRSVLRFRRPWESVPRAGINIAFPSAETSSGRRSQKLA
jgi:hypothetical protein